MENWVNSKPEVFLLILMLTQFIILWLILMGGNTGKEQG